MNNNIQNSTINTSPAIPFSAVWALIISVIFLVNPLLTSWASDTDIEQLNEQQKKLQQLLDQIGEVQDQSSQQKALLEKFDRQMECNWTLIQSYDNCEKSHKNNLQEHLNCKLKAKEKAARCLSETNNEAR